MFVKVMMLLQLMLLDQDKEQELLLLTGETMKDNQEVVQEGDLGEDDEAHVVHPIQVCNFLEFFVDVMSIVHYYQTFLYFFDPIFCC